MIFTLHRYIFREVFKVFILTTVALTLIMSLGSILQPVQEYGVGPRQVVHLMGYFLPITLTFVLPMAALFAAALVYGRFASDSELDACKASGISLMALIYPGLALAIMVAIANLLLSFYVMPVFVHRAEKSLKDDAKQILFRNIRRKGYYRLPPDGRYLIYADRADPQSNALSGVVTVESKGGKIQKVITAERAQLGFASHKMFNEVQVTAVSSSQMDSEGSLAIGLTSFTVEFGSLLGDDITFKKVGEMKRIACDPLEFYPIAKLARLTYAQFIAELLAQDIEKSLPAKDANNTVENLKLQSSAMFADSTAKKNLYKLYSGEKIIEFAAGNCAVKDERKIQLGGQVLVFEYDIVTRELLQTLQTTQAFLHIEGEQAEPTLTMDIRSATWKQPNGLEGLTRRYVIRGLILPTAIKDKFKTGNLLDDIIAAALQNGPSPELEALQNKLQRKIRSTMAEIRAEVHSRLVFGIGCVAMILIGIALGIIKKGGHMLTAFGASCVPAAVLVVCIMMGKNITKNLDARAGSGIVLMWAGLVFLSLLAVAMYHRLLKN